LLWDDQHNEPDKDIGATIGARRAAASIIILGARRRGKFIRF